MNVETELLVQYIIYILFRGYLPFSTLEKMYEETGQLGFALYFRGVRQDLQDVVSFDKACTMGGNTWNSVIGTTTQLSSSSGGSGVNRMRASIPEMIPC